MKSYKVPNRLLRRLVLRLLPLFLAALFLGFQARPAQAAPSAANCIWNGSSSQLWSNPLNWFCSPLPLNRVPMPGDSVLIPNGSFAGPSVDVASIVINDLSVNTGKSVILGNNVDIYLFIMTVNGEIDLNGHNLSLYNTTSILVSGPGSKIDGLGTMHLTCSNPSYCSPLVSIFNNGSISAYTEIDPTMTVIARTDNGGQWGTGTITVDAFSTLQVADSYFLNISGDIDNYGIVTGHGTLEFSGENFTNNNGVSVDELRFLGGSAVYLSGTGTWTSGLVDIIDGTGVYLNNSMTWSIVNLLMYDGSDLGLGSYNLTFDSNVSINVANANTRVDGTGLLTLKKTATLVIYTGSITTPLAVDPSGTGIPAIVTASSDDGGSVKLLNVASGATLNIDSGYSLLVTGPLNVAIGGVVSGGGWLDEQGASLTNNGNISVYHLVLDSSAMSLSGSGGWTPTIIEVAASKQATLANDMVWAASGVTIGSVATLELGAQNLTLSGPGTITINFNSTQSAINGTGTLKFQTNITLNLYDAAIGAPCVIDSGTTSVQANYGEFMKDVTVSNGAALAVLGGSSLVVSGNVQVAQGGTISGDGSSLHFWGGTFHSDGLVSISAVWFQGVEGANLALTGNGTFDPTQLTVVPGIGLTIQNSPTIYAIWVEPGASLNLVGANLTLTGPGLALNAQGAFTSDAASTVIYQGTQSQQINASSFSRLTINNLAGVSLTKDLTVTTSLNLIQGVLALGAKNLTLSGPGTITINFNSAQSAINGTGTLKFQTNITLNLYDAAIGAPCVIDSGTTSVQANYGEFMKDVTVSNGAALAVLGGSSLVVSGNVQVAQGGTISGDGSSLHFWGGTFHSDGLVNIGAVLFQGVEGANLALTGNGTFNPTQLTVVPGIGLTIQNSPTIYAIWVEPGASLNLVNANLMLTGPGLALNAQGAFTSDAGSTVIYQGSQVQQINASSFSRLTITNLAGVSLTKDLTVTTSLNLIQGVLDINTKLLNLKAGWQKTGGSLQSAASGTVVYSKTSLPQSIMPAQYGNLTVSGASKTLSLAGASVDGRLTLNTDIQTSGAAVKLVLTPNATTTGNGDVIGKVERVGPFTKNHMYSFGNPGTAITFTVGTALPTSIDVTLVKTAPAGLNNALARTYTITKVGTGAFTASLRLHYLPAELHGMNPNTLCIWRQDLSVWTSLPISSSNPVSAWLETKGITSFTVFGLANKTGYRTFLPFLKR